MMRQRLVGALVLLCGGVILWSLLFTGPAAYKVDRETQIPDAPLVDPIINTPPQKPSGVMSADAEIVPAQPNLVVADEDKNLTGSAVKAQAGNIPDALDRPKSKAPVSSPKPKVSQTKKPEPTAKKIDSNGLPPAWVVQVGVFGSQSNADGLKKSLQSAGYKAFIDEISRNGKPLYRVLVGPVISNEKAVSQQAAINRRFNVKSIVNRFEP
ncbi:Cell division protein DedD [Zhongshania aliphaticivorans]|uniref:Cell division protein DedD n=1 Tax=Zhongshania aliphaticivorans TaxID=1470434 RepID=A0A5S9QQ86_9GAMM|nr:SPOR domain-containing protein [Zhongshania aliphaticivorans]CAA0087923.1 Cell division protein DedD [Zhongshania aliphaticivorans]CAA0115663.1 Cell division protein DedD [Zhongshania aliphaticivorans]CAA0120271.1 Cell division protein DedD [Zhongshania aliphaticivorans]